MRRTLALIFGGLSFILLAFLGIGLLLPGTWSAERSIELEAPPEEVFGVLEDLRAWGGWTPWGDVESVISEPSSGVGATRSWDDDRYGQGVIRIVRVEPDRLVAYRVELEGGKASIDGSFELLANGAGTRLSWTEAGDYGRNPLMGYVARRMSGFQGSQMEGHLARLAELVRQDPEPD
jgi:polyketide cyclase/dehydrase/lipid transport protein